MGKFESKKVADQQSTQREIVLFFRDMVIVLSAVVLFLENNEQLIPYIVTATVAVVYSVSVTLSVKIYENKDL